MANESRYENPNEIESMYDWGSPTPQSASAEVSTGKQGKSSAETAPAKLTTADDKDAPEAYANTNKVLSDRDMADERTSALPAAELPPSQEPEDSGTGSAQAGMVLCGARAQYRLLRPLGEGGMGSVFLGRTMPIDETSEDSKVQREQNPALAADTTPIPGEVAVKLFQTDIGMNPELLLKRELSALRALRHPRIPQVHDWSTVLPRPFAVFSFFASGSLADEVKLSGQLSVKQAWRLVHDLLDALTGAHRACLLHLDVKPANVLRDGEGGYMLSDFGISQGTLVSRAVVATGLGAPIFQSPEQRAARHESFDIRTDLWGVGVTVWTAMIAPTVAQMRKYLVQGGAVYGLPFPSTIRKDVPADLESVLMPLLCIDPDKRPGSAAEVLAKVRGMMGVAGSSAAEAAAGPKPWPGENAAASSASNAADSSGLQPDSPSGAAPCAASDPYDLGTKMSRVDRVALQETLMDPLWNSLCSEGMLDDYLRRIPDGTVLGREGEESYACFVLLRGRVQILREEKVLGIEDREGAFLGEVSALTGNRRTATMKSTGEVAALAFNPARFERFIAKNPAVAIRLIKGLAERLSKESARVQVLLEKGK